MIASAGSSATLAECLEKSGRLASEIGGEVVLALDPVGAGASLPIPSFARVIKSREPGVSAARNAGLSASRGDIFLLIDDDCLVGDAGWFADLRRTVEGGEDLLHGGSYELPPGASYWARVYAWVNRAWLERGKNPESQAHLLGGVLFGSSRLKNQVVFSSGMKWGGEEKELLARLYRKGVAAVWHPHLTIEHRDRSGIARFLRRAFRQGEAAGNHGLIRPAARQTSRPPWGYLPGLLIFYSMSRTGMLLGSRRRLKNGKVKKAA
nr:glycosyltransferase [Pseudobdellovibrionaceae bacterium]